MSTVQNNYNTSTSNINASDLTNTRDYNDLTFEFTPEELGIDPLKAPRTKTVTDKQVEEKLFDHFKLDINEAKKRLKTDDPFQEVLTKGDNIVTYNEKTGKYQKKFSVKKSLYNKLAGRAKQIKQQIVEENSQTKQTKPQTSTNPNEAVAGKTGIDNSRQDRTRLGQLADQAQVLKTIFGEPTKLTDLKHFTVKQINVPGYSAEDNALASLIEDKYGSGNLWGDKKAEILQIAKSVGVKVENLTPNENGTVSFDLNVESTLKLQHAYIGVQEKFNIDKANADETIAKQPINRFCQGVVDGAWEDLKANWKMVTNPWQTVKDVASGAWELGKLGAQLAAMPVTERDVLFAQIVRAGGENLANMEIGEAAYKLGKIVGIAAVEIALFKGAGVVAGTGLKTLKAISGSKFGLTLLNSAANIAKEVKQTVGKIPIPKGITPALVTLDGEIIKFSSFEMAKLGDITKLMSKSSEELEMLNNGSKAGRTVIKETAEKGLTEKAQSGMKRLKYELPKEIMAKAKEQLVTINVARTELIARLDDLAKSSNLLADTKVLLSKARNSLQKHLKQDDLVGALRDLFGKDVRRSGDGYTYQHLKEVQNGISSLDNAVGQMTKELNRVTKGSDEYVKLSKEIDALKEMKRRVQTFLETK